MRRVRYASGFTLIEMIVAMAIFAILVALTVPSMRTWIANSKVRAVADGLQNGIRLAQAESLRRSRQVVFALTNNSAPSTGYTALNNGFTASGTGTYWAVVTIPAMIDGTENPEFISSGVLSAASGTVQVSGPAEICFNSVGRLVANAATGVSGGSCTTPANTSYTISVTGADHPLQVEVALGGQLHLCDPSQTLSASNPYGC